MTKPTIVFCHLLNDFSGSPMMLRQSINALKDEYDVKLFVGSRAAGVLSNLQIPTYEYWYRRTSSRLVTFLAYLISQFFLYRALNRFARSDQNILIYVNTLLPFGAILWGGWRSSKILVHVHEATIAPNFFKYFLLFLARKFASKVVYVSNSQSCLLPVAGVASSVLLNPVSLDIQRSGMVSDSKDKESFKVLMLTYPRKYKGINEFFRLAQCCADSPDLLFQIVLNAPSREIDGWREKYSNLKNIEIFGATSTPADFYSKAHLLLNLSRVDLVTESFGLTVVEALSFGLPVIVPPVGGPSEIISDGIHGYFIDSRDTEQIRSRILELQSNDHLYQQLSRSARERSRDFSYDRYEMELLRIIRNVYV